MHGLESLHGYEERLVESVRRQPSEFRLLMVDRMLNCGTARVGGVDLLSILKEVAVAEGQSEEVRSEARGFVEWQRSER